MAAYASSSPSKAGPVLVIVLAILVTPLLAAFNALLGAAAVLPYLALAALIALLVLPLNLLVLGAFFLASVVAGMADYFGHVSQGFWIPYLMGALFALRALVERLRVRARQPASHTPRGLATPVVLVFAVLYLLMLVASAVVAVPPLPQLIVATKNYLFLWGLLLALLWVTWRPAYSSWMWTLVIVVACLQAPVTLYQRFFVAAKRGDATAWDAVVGTLGGNPDFGGHSAAMALLCCLAIAILLFRMRERRLNALHGWLLVLWCLVPIAAAEVKAGFIWLAVVFAFFFVRQVFREPLRAVLILIVGVVLLLGLGWVYVTTQYAQQGSVSLSEIYDKQIKYAIDPYEYRAAYKRLGRVASVVDWWRKHDLADDPVHMLIGHGAGASRSSSSFGAGELARRLRTQLDITGVSTLLWDIGLLGALAFMGFLASSAASGYRLSLRPALPPAWRESGYIASVLLTMLFLGMFYNRDAIDHPAVQVLLFFSVAQVVLGWRALQAASPAKAPVKPLRDHPATILPTRPSTAG